MMVAIMIAAAITAAGYSPWLGVAAGLAFAPAWWRSCRYFIAVRPILAFDRFSFGWLVSTLGFAVVVENAAAYIWGPTSRAFPPILNGLSLHYRRRRPDRAATPGDRGRRSCSPSRLRVGAQHTLFGKLGMAIASDPEMASAIGANTAVVAIVAFAISGLFAGIAGRADRPEHLCQPLSRPHLRHLRLHRDDDRRRHGKAGRGDVRRPAARRSGRGRQRADQFAGVRLVSVPGAGRDPDRDARAACSVREIRCSVSRPAACARR